MDTLRLRLLVLTILFGLPVALRAAEPINFPFSVNEVVKGEAPIIVTDDGDVLMRAADLERGGLSGPKFERLIALSRAIEVPEPIEGGESVSLRSLSPIVTYSINEETVSLSITVDPLLLGPTVLSARQPRPSGIVYAHDPTAFFNYSLSSPSLHEVAGYGEAGVTIGPGLLLGNFSRPTGKSLLRGITNYTVDDRDHLRRWTFGDAPVSTGSLGGASTIVGATVSRNFSLDPYFIRFPSMTFSGTATTPSRAGIYVNGILVTQQDVPPGPFQFTNVQVAPGAGTAVLVVRDAFGRESTQAADYYYSTSILAKGLSEYVYSAGVTRKNLGTRSFDTGDPAFIGFHRVGVTESITVGGRGEASRDLVSAGALSSFRTPFGDLGLNVAGSRASGSSGAASELAYRFLTRRFGFGIQARTMSREYANLSLSPSMDRPLTDTNLTASFSARFGSLAAQAARFRMRDAATSDRISLLGSVSLGSRVSLLASVSSVLQESERHAEYFAGASFNLGGGATASTSVTHRPAGNFSTFEVHRSLPVGTGVSYRAETQFDPEGTSVSAAAVQYQTNFGRAEISGDPTDSSSRPSIGLAGGVIFASGHLEFSQPVQDSFALVRVPGVAGVRVYSSNQLIGRTDSKGELLVPNLLSYYGNPLRIEDRDIPMDYEIDAVERVIAPPYRGGAVVVFPVRRHTSITGAISVKAGDAIAPASLGTLMVSDGKKTWESPLGRDGEFYLENIPAGSLSADVEYSGGRCRFQLRIPDEAVADLGRLTCVLAVHEGAVK